MHVLFVAAKDSREKVTLHRGIVKLWYIIINTTQTKYLEKRMGRCSVHIYEKDYSNEETSRIPCQVGRQ